MFSRLVALSLVAVFLISPGCSARESSRARALVREAVATLARETLEADRVDWPALESRMLARLPPDASLDDARKSINEAVAALGDRHARFTPPSLPARSSPAPPSEASAAAADAAQPAASPVVTRRVPDLPEGAMLDTHVAYVVAPGCAAPSVDGLRIYARAAVDLIETLHKQQPRGWIIDLRLNSGGNIWPMLLGFRPLLRNGVVSTMIGGPRSDAFGVNADAAWMGTTEGPAPQLTWGEVPTGHTAIIDAPVAVLIDRWTMSSGEGLAIAFRVRPVVRFFGGSTSGLTTVTNSYRLSDGSTLLLPVAQMGDADGRPVYGAIAPDQLVEMGDWPASDDAASRAAAAWILAQALSNDAPR
ncbi:MAG: S41 family peptidase [Planctomycetota bacterium]|nr:S41 family peptidase [Planctomycetota bacterium]